jgi:putative DNA primase/helicase
VAAPIVERIAEWAPVHEDELRAAEPDIPDEIDDRAQDIWEPLIAIADLAGGDWPETARRAAVAIHRDRGLDDQSSGVLLLRAVSAAFAKGGVFIGGDLKITTDNLVKLINANDEYPFGGWNNGGGLHPRNLNAMLKAYGVHSIDIKFSGGTRKGFGKVAFTDAWSRYTPDLAVQPSATSATNPQPNRNSSQDRKPRKSRITTL